MYTGLHFADSGKPQMKSFKRWSEQEFVPLNSNEYFTENSVYLVFGRLFGFKNLSLILQDCKIYLYIYMSCCFNRKKLAAVVTRIIP